jgi:DMSO/TMAO reductase YedYZ molybdopterin-dependent catalytic subunit
MKKIGIVLILAMFIVATQGCTSQKALSFDVTGLVDKPGTYDLNNYNDRLVTITAKLDGEVTHLPRQNYTGVPVRVVLADAGLKEGATKLTVSASDGYSQIFDLSNVTASDDLILINQNDTVRLVAKGYAGGMWVEMVTDLEVS